MQDSYVQLQQLYNTSRAAAAAVAVPRGTSAATAAATAAAAAAGVLLGGVVMHAENPLVGQLFKETEIAASIREMKTIDPSFRCTANQLSPSTVSFYCLLLLSPFTVSSLLSHFNCLSLSVSF